MRTWMKAPAMAVAMLTGLVGCGSGEEGGATAEAVVAVAAPEVVVQVSGNYSGTFESTGSIFCAPDEFGGPIEGFELYAMKSSEQLNLRMLRNTAPGQYSITDGIGAPIKFYYSDPQRVKYDQIKAAAIQLEAVPQAQGERLIGNITASLQSDDGEAVEVDIRLDLDAGSQSFDECKPKT